MEIAWEAVARTPRCMMWLDMTDDGILFICLICNPQLAIFTSANDYLVLFIKIKLRKDRGADA